MKKSTTSTKTNIQNGATQPKPKFKSRNESQETLLARARSSQCCYDWINAAHTQFPQLIIRSLELYHEAEAEQQSLI